MDIGYKYNYGKVLYLITTVDTDSTKSGINYLSKYPETFYNVEIFPVDCSLVTPKFFQSVNEVEPHNKYRQSYLDLKKYWVNKCDWI